MNKYLSFFLTAVLLLSLLTGCSTTPCPRAEERLQKYAPLPTEENCILRWKSNTFKLHPNRQYAVFNGVPVQLPAPPMYGEDKIYRVTPMTMRNIIDPLMTGKMEQHKVKRILIDPGHGGHDAGAIGKISKEKDLNFLLAKEIASALQRAGFTVVMTRTNDRFIPLKERAELVRKQKADLFISVHHNASKSNPNAAGIECFAHRFSRPEDTLLAFMVQHHLVLASGSVNRGIKFANFAVLRNNPVPSILIEAGFITNAAEERSLADPRWRSRAGAAVADAVRAYARLGR